MRNDVEHLIFIYHLAIFFFFLVTYWVFGKLGVILPLLTYSIFFKVHLGGNVFIKIYCPLSQGC